VFHLISDIESKGRESDRKKDKVDQPKQRRAITEKRGSRKSSILAGSCIISVVLQLQRPFLLVHEHFFPDLHAIYEGFRDIRRLLVVRQVAVVAFEL
jgi:hypothetical protein